MCTEAKRSNTITTLGNCNVAIIQGVRWEIRRGGQEMKNGRVVKRQTAKGFTYQVRECLSFQESKCKPPKAFKQWNGMC